VDDVLRDTWTDALVVLHDGHLVEERYLSGMSADTPHLLMSVSKSIVGCVAGILVDEGSSRPGGW
jgi:CubicO group peptidase (beta-lactamase class C family)